MLYESFGLMEHLSAETSETEVQEGLQQQIIQVSYAINHNTSLGVVFNSAIEESMGRVQRSGEAGQL